jgi:hypothetical protein
MTIMVVVAIILLVLHWKGPNAVWGGATGGAVVGLIIALVKGDWGLMALSFAIGTFSGTFFEWVGRLANYIKRRRG